MSRPLKVLVIGGGIGGLCLAHGLRAAGVDVRVHERNRTRDDWLQGYRIHINPAGSSALHACLPERNWAAFDASAGRPSEGFGFLDERLRRLAFIEEDMMSADPADPIAQHRSVSRILLRTVLLDGLDDVITYDREFTRYEIAADGRVSAHFADGSHDTGDILVAADGANSRVRRQYLPDARRIDTGVVAVAGKHALDGRLPASLTGGPNNIIPPRSSWMFTAVWQASPAAPGQPAIDGQDYVFWAYVAAADRYPADVHELDGAALQQVVLDRITDWSPDLHRLVSGSDPQSVNPIALRSMESVKAWPASTVTLIGDAIHNMTPLAGIGANTALRDAAVLTRRLTGITDRAAAVPAIAEYEREMLDYGFAAVRLSLRNARQAASDARLPRSILKTTLRAAQAVPPLKRAMFAGMGT